jgi:serine/threonine-protein kinase
MAGESRVFDLVDRALSDQLTPEQVCAHDPELLGEVKARLKVCRNLDVMLGDVFPSDMPLASVAALGFVDTRLPTIPGYELLGVLGRGGVGVIYRVRHLKLNRIIALKMLLSGEFARGVEVARFMREARAVAALKHPNIVQIYDVGEVEGRPYFTMELVEGGSLAQRIATTRTPQDPKQAAELVAILARAMHVAHQAGIVHRDLKPGNILLSCDGVPKISDFGLASRFDGECSLTGTETRMGTPSYMSPEQTTGARQANSPAVDVYALGAILYELLTGQPPFRAKTALETQRKVVSDEPIRPSRASTKVQRDLDTICLKCLSKDPASRYRTAAELADDLERFLRFEPITARPARLVERTVKWFRRRTAIAVSLVLGIVLLPLGVGIAFWSGSQRARVASEIEEDLRDVSSMDAAGRWSNAEAALHRAQGLLNVRSSDELQRRVNDARENLTLDARLDAVRLGRASAGALPFYQRRADADYEVILGDSQHLVFGSDIQKTATKVKASPARTALLAALDDWACATSDASRREWILKVASLSDPNSEAWRERIRDESQWTDLQATRDLATSVPAADVPVSTLLIIGERLHGAPQTRQTFLAEVQKGHPGDFYANLALGDAMIFTDAREAEACYRAALTARPEDAVSYGAVADSLRERHQFEEATGFYAEALERDPNYARAKCGLAATYLAEQHPNDAIAACYESLKLDRNYAWSHYYLAGALSSLGRLEEATQHYAIMYKEAPEAHDVSDAYRAELIQAGKMNEVREIFWDKPVQDPATSYDRCKGYAEFCLFTGNVADYGATCTALLDRFGSTTSVQMMRQIACTCLLLPGPEEDGAELQRACELADRSMTNKKPTDGDYANYVFVKALADFRRGDFDSAIKEAGGDGSRIMGPCPKLIMAMAFKGQGRNAEAEHMLAEASVKFDWRVGSADSADLWVYHILLREAQSRIVPDLGSLVNGSRQPIDNDQRAILIAACQSAHLDRLCTQTFIDAQAVESTFIEVRRTNPRFVAACASAALAVSRESENQHDAIKPDPHTLRELTCQWLSKVLHAQVRQPPMGVNGRNWLSREFACWQRDPGLADLRDSVRLESSRPEFRSECAALWKLLDDDIVRLQVAKPATPSTRSTRRP